MIEFKQIIGRGTRLFDGKDYFTIYDYVGAYQHFADPEWDGEPEDPEPHSSPRPHGPMDEVDPPIMADPPTPFGKIKIKLKDGKERSIGHMMATSFWSADGRPVSAEQFLTNLYGILPGFFSNEEELRSIWSNPLTRKTLLEKLDEAGFNEEALNDLQKMIDAEKSDLFDVLEYVSFAVLPISREERVAYARSNIFALLDDRQKEFLTFVLGKYIESGVGELAQEKLPNLLQLKYHSLTDASEILGGVDKIRETFVGFQKWLYEKVA